MDLFNIGDFSNPYKGYLYRLIWNGRYVVGAITASISVGQWDLGNLKANRIGPGMASRPTRGVITLERGLTKDAKFTAWARISAAQPARSGQSGAVLLEICDKSGRKISKFSAQNCWVSEFNALPDMDAGANNVVIERIRLESEGWERTDNDDDDPNTE